VGNKGPPNTWFESRAPGQIFLRSGTWGLPVLKSFVHGGKLVGKTQGTNFILSEEYESVLFLIIVISYLVLFLRAIPQ
jgi:hypothetical protein